MRNEHRQYVLDKHVLILLIEIVAHRSSSLSSDIANIHNLHNCYLQGNQFTLSTDNKPHTHLESQPTLSSRSARWSEYLQCLQFSWVQKPEEPNVADPLSCNPNFKAMSLVLAVATRRQTQAQQTVTAADSAPAARCRRQNDSTALPVHTEPENIAAGTELGSDAAHTADIVSMGANAYAADPVFADEQRMYR